MKAILMTVGVAVLALSGCSKPSAGLVPADAIYSGGNIITVNDAQPSVQAIAIKDGKILAVGDVDAVSAAHKGSKTKVIDLAGKTLLPGFIDAHSHFLNGMAMEDQANVTAPPVGPASTAGEIVEALKTFSQAKGKKPGEMIFGYGYDDNMLPADHPLTRDDLDPAFPDNPVIVLHVSTHGAVLNSAALKKFGISAETPTPAGGVIARKPGSREPTGLLMETAWLALHDQLLEPNENPEQERNQLRYAQNLYAAAGVTTAQDGASMAAQVTVLDRAASKGELFIDVISYTFINDIDVVLAQHPASTFGTYKNRLKLGGCKILSDGSPQGKTAFFTTPYLTGGPSGEKDWKGEPTFPQDLLNGMFKKCYDQGLQVIAHANGDAGIDAVLQAHQSAAAGSLAKDRRTVIIHSQFVRKDQLQKYVEYKMIPSFFTEHTFFFGAAHVNNRGAQQAAFISPMKSAIAAGLRPTNHTDFSVVPIDQMMVIWSAVNRKMRSGEVLGPDERISALDAIKAVTINAAYQYSEESRKGSLEPGKLADLVILDRNPLTVPADEIRNITVLETIKEGRTIYTAP